jgi:hypothetical protein
MGNVRSELRDSSSAEGRTQNERLIEENMIAMTC